MSDAPEASDIVERIAMAILKTVPDGYGITPEEAGMPAAEARSYARAALKAMREPLNNAIYAKRIYGSVEDYSDGFNNGLENASDAVQDLITVALEAKPTS